MSTHIISFYLNYKAGCGFWPVFRRSGTLITGCLQLLCVSLVVKTLEIDLFIFMGSSSLSVKSVDYYSSFYDHKSLK